MRISKFVAPVSLLTLGLAGPAAAFDGNASTGAAGVAPAVTVDVVGRGSVASPPVSITVPALAAPGPTITAPGPSLAAPPRSLDLSRKPSSVEAFRSGTQSIMSGDVKAGVAALDYAAANGHVVAQWKLGRMYADGEGVTRNDYRAFQYFRDIVENHADDTPSTQQARFVANAFVALGQYYLDGIANSPITSDAEKARQMFQYSASYFGDADAQYNLGRLYLDGDSKDIKLAARWLQRAATKGQHQAQALLGDMLFKGELVPRQAARGLMWLTLASDAAAVQETWIRDLHDQAFKQATDEERQAALTYIERRLGRPSNP